MNKLTARAILRNNLPTDIVCHRPDSRYPRWVNNKFTARLTKPHENRIRSPDKIIGWFNTFVRIKDEKTPYNMNTSSVINMKIRLSINISVAGAVDVV